MKFRLTSPGVSFLQIIVSRSNPLPCFFLTPWLMFLFQYFVKVMWATHQPANCPIARGPWKIPQGTERLTGNDWDSTEWRQGEEGRAPITGHENTQEVPGSKCVDSTGPKYRELGPRPGQLWGWHGLVQEAKSGDQSQGLWFHRLGRYFPKRLV